MLQKHKGLSDAVIILVLSMVIFLAISRVNHNEFLAIQLHGRTYLAEESDAVTESAVRIYTASKNTISFQPTEDGTYVTLDLFPYPAETYLVREAGNLVQVDDARGTRRLDGRWQDGELIDPATGRTDSGYWQQITWDSPTPASALALFQSEKNMRLALEEKSDGTADRTEYNQWLIAFMLAIGVGFVRLCLPSKRDRKVYEKHPLYKRILFIALSVCFTILALLLLFP